MRIRLPDIALLVLLLLTAGCSSTPMPDMFIQHFNQAASSEEASKCMSKQALFNNRQLMVAPTAVENAWTHCLNQFGIWAPGQTEKASRPNPWGLQ